MSDQWKLVPVEPTEEMLAAARPAYSSNIQASNTANREKYQRMLAAAPTQGADARPVAISDEDIRLTLKAHFIIADHRLTNAVRDLLNGKFRAYQSPVNKPAADISPVGYVTQDDLCRLKNGMGAIVSPTNGVATVPVYAASDAAPSDAISDEQLVGITMEHGYGPSMLALGTSAVAGPPDKFLPMLRAVISASAPREKK